MAIDQTRARRAPLVHADATDPRLFLREEELDRAADLILSAARSFFRSADVALAAHGLGPAHYRALATIRRGTPATVTELLARLQVRKQSLARVLKELESAGLIRRAPAPHDGRARLVMLTPAGEAAERGAAAALRERLARVFRRAGADAVSGARAVLTALARDEEDGP